MHGKISVKSQLGKGSLFTVELKFRLDGSEPEPVSLPSLRILAVDHDAVSRGQTASTLNALGMDTEWAGDMEEAVIKAGEACSRNMAFDAAIMDVQSDGVDMAEYVMGVRSEIGYDIPILFACSYDSDEIDARAMPAGVNVFLRKPLFKSELCRELSLLVNREGDGQEKGICTGDYDFTGCRFLLVEDNELNREIALELLSDTGAMVETASNGEEGVRCFENAPAGYYTLILMDIQMPVMDGYTATRKIRGLNRPDADAIPILAMTANAFAEDIAACAEAGMNAHLAKPLDMQTVQNTIQTYILQQGGYKDVK